MEKLLPYVTAALLCEKVLIEKDESITLLRITDKIQYSLQGIGVTLPEGIKPMVNVQGLVSIKAGPVTGDHTLTVILERPDGDRKDVATVPVKFLGKDQGQNLILQMGLGIDRDGLYWFDVLFDGDSLTRVPLMVTALQEPGPTEQNT